MEAAAARCPPARPPCVPAAIMLALISRLLDWFRSLFWKEEMELTLVGLQYSGKTTFVNVIAVRALPLTSPARGRHSRPQAGPGPPRDRAVGGEGAGACRVPRAAAAVGGGRVNSLESSRTLSGLGKGELRLLMHLKHLGVWDFLGLALGGSPRADSSLSLSRRVGLGEPVGPESKGN